MFSKTQFDEAGNLCLWLSKEGGWGSGGVVGVMETDQQHRHHHQNPLSLNSIWAAQIRLGV